MSLVVKDVGVPKIPQCATVPDRVTFSPRDRPGDTPFEEQKVVQESKAAEQAAQSQELMRMVAMGDLLWGRRIQVGRCKRRQPRVAESEILRRHQHPEIIL